MAPKFSAMTSTGMVTLGSLSPNLNGNPAIPRGRFQHGDCAGQLGSVSVIGRGAVGAAPVQQRDLSRQREVGGKSAGIIRVAAGRGIHDRSGKWRERQGAPPNANWVTLVAMATHRIGMLVGAVSQAT